MTRRKQASWRAAGPILLLAGLGALLWAGCGGGGGRIGPGSPGDGTLVEPAPGVTLRVIDVGRLRVRTDVYEGRVYMAFDETAISYLRAVHRAEGNVIAYWKNRTSVFELLVSFWALLPPAAGGPESVVGPYSYHDWSPDGSQLATDGACRVNYDGTAPSLPLFSANDLAWSSDGMFVVYHRWDDNENDLEIYRQSWTGGDEEQLTENSVYDHYVTVSPDGQKVAFVAGWDGSGDEIFTQDARGLNSNRLNLTNNSVRDSWPQWSPDGSLIAFDSKRDGDCEIFTIEPDGRNEFQLTDNGVNDEEPCWSPDGSKIVFRSYRDDPSYGELYMMNADGSNVVRLTNNHDFYEWHATWSPAVLNHPRVYVGPGGRDRATNATNTDPPPEGFNGFDPPFGTQIDGAILMMNQTPCRPPDTGCLAFDVDRPKTVTITRLDQPGVVYEVTATSNFQGMWEDRQAGNAPLVSIGPPPAPIPDNTVADLVVIFDPATGRPTHVVPVSASAAVASRVLSLGGVTLRRQFLGCARRVGDQLVWEEF